MSVFGVTASPLQTLIHQKWRNKPIVALALRTLDFICGVGVGVVGAYSLGSFADSLIDLQRLGLDRTFARTF